MSRIAVENGKSFEFRNPNVDKAEIEKVINEAKSIIQRGASPFMDTLKIINNTKHVNVFIGFSDGKMIVTINNPADEIFDLNEPETVPHAAKE
jgi:hypothetical protein